MESKQLKKLMDETTACGFPNVRLRDAAFAILNFVIKDQKTAFALLFPSENPDFAKEYASTPLQKNLAKRVKAMIEPQPTAPATVPKKEKSEAELSFDENKAAMLRMLKEIEEQKEKPDADIAKLLKIEADIRVKLNDKFEVTTAAEEQLIIVQPKFNHICEQTGCECWLQTKEFAMSHWGLVDPNN